MRNDPLTVPPDQSIPESSTLVVTNTATDPDVPANTLTFSLVSAPPGINLDSSTGILYFGTGNASPDLIGAVRPGCNPWTDAVVALKARSGAFVWGHTLVCPDLWDYDTDQTPIAMTGYDAHSKGLERWDVAAQQHYSLFENLEKDSELNVYKFNLWDTVYDRLSINFIAFMGDDILDNGPIPADDEEYLTSILSRKLGRRTC